MAMLSKFWQVFLCLGQSVLAIRLEIQVYGLNSRTMLVHVHFYTFIKKKPAILGLFFVYFHPPKQILQFLQQIYVKKCYDHSVYSTGIQTHDRSNTSLFL